MGRALFSKKNSFFRHVSEEFVFVLFIASFVFILHHNTPIFSPFDSASLHLSTAISKKHVSTDIKSVTHRGNFQWLEIPDQSHYSPVLLTYDQTIFENVFHETQPLDRCVLSEDIKQIFSQNPKVVTIDIDMSPLKLPNDYYKECQKRLDQTLDFYGSKLVLIAPVHDVEMNVNSVTEKWINEKEKHGITFANPKLESALGIVINRSSYNNSMAMTTAYKFETTQHNVSINNTKSEHKNPINFLNAGKFMPIDKDADISIQDRAVFLGGVYGIEDFYLTPIGENIPGVMIHAYDFFTIFNPIQTSGWASVIALLLDIVTAIVVGYYMKSLWNKYIHKIKDDESGSKSFFLFPTMILIPLFTFAAIGIWLSSMLLKNNIWISPIPILIAIFLDGMISTLMEHATEKETEESYVSQELTSNMHYISNFTKKICDYKIWYCWLKITIMFGTILTVIYIVLQGFYSHH